MTTAYAAQDALVERILARHGGHVIGYKIACTNTIAQQLMGVDAPVYGQLMSSFAHPSPAKCLAGDFTICGIEPEFAFEIARDVPPADQPYTAETIVPYVAQAFPSIEIVDHRFAGWDAFDVYTLIADNAIHGAWISGAPCATWHDLDLQTHAVRLLANDTEVSTGSGASVLGHPLNALAWLANELPTQGRALRQGERVTTGLSTGLYLAQPGDHVQADFGAFGSVEITFS
jgi:2-keto-4-pentenoate hydratase